MHLRNQNPEQIAKCKAARDYEPAAVLLAKIKSEKNKYGRKF